MLVLGIMGRKRYATFAMVACLLCIVGFISAYYNFEGYEDLDPEQNNLAIIKSGEAFVGSFKKTDQVWVYVPEDNLTDVNFAMSTEGEDYSGTEPNFFDTTLISEDGTRFYSPSVKIGPGFEGDLLIENNGSATLYLVDMVMMGEDLWNQPSVQFMAAFCCLGPVFALIGIIGVIRGTDRSESKPKILVFGPGGVPTTEELYNSLNQIEKKSDVEPSIPDPWIENNQLDPILDVSPSPEMVGQTDQKNIDRDDDWKGWDEG